MAEPTDQWFGHLHVAGGEVHLDAAAARGLLGHRDTSGWHGTPEALAVALRDAGWADGLDPVWSAPGTARTSRGTGTAHQVIEVRTRRTDDGLEGIAVDVSADAAVLALHQAVIDGMDATVGAVTPDLTYAVINQPVQAQLEELYGHRYEVGDDVLSGMSPEMAEASRAVWDRTLAGEAWTLEREFGDLHTLAYESRFYPLHDADGEVIGAAGWGYEISDRVRAEAELKRSLAAMEDFAHVVAHDLREPLRGIGIYLEFLRRQFDADEPDIVRMRELVAAMTDTLDRGDRLVRDLLAYAKVPRPDPSAAPVALDGIVADAVARLRPQLEARRAVVNVDGPLPAVRAASRALVDAVANLLANAIAYDPSDPLRIEISAVLEDDAVELRVTDHGTGIRPEHHEAAFEMFRRLDPREGDEGTGAGLGIVRRICEQHGGTARIVDSAPDAGTTVGLRLPRVVEG